MKECYRRDQSIVPQQALAIANAALVHDSAAAIADRLGGTSAAAASTAIPLDDIAFTARAFVAILGRRPTAAETAVCLESLAAWRGQGPADGTPAPAGDHSRTQLVWSLLNHTEFLTIR